MNKTNIISAYSQLGIKDVTVYVMKDWDSHINPLTTISPEEGVYNLTVLEESQFKRLLSSLHLADGYDNELRNISCNIVITHQVDFCRFVGVYTYGQIPTKVHQFITDAGVNEINKLTKLQQGRIATFYLTLRNNPLFSMVEKIIDYDGNTYDEIMAKIYDTYRVLDVEFESLFNSPSVSFDTPDFSQEEEKLKQVEEIKDVEQNEMAFQAIPVTSEIQSVQPENQERVKPMNITNSPLSSDDLELFRAKLKQSIINKLDPIFDDIIEQEINKFKVQVEQNILSIITSHLTSK